MYAPPKQTVLTNRETAIQGHSRSSVVVPIDTCIVIIRCILVRIQVYGWIVQFSVHPDTKARPRTPSRLFPVPPEREVVYG